MNDLAPVLVLGIITLGTYRIFELFIRRSERMAIIDKLTSGVDFSGLKGGLDLNFFRKTDYSSWALKIALLLIGIGIGTVVAFAIVASVGGLDYLGDGEHYRRFRGQIELLYPSCICIFGGLGLLIAYLIEQKKSSGKE